MATEAKTITADELKDWADGVIPILFDIEVAMTNLRIISVERANRLHVLGHGFFRHYVQQQKFIVVVQMAKIFSYSPNQRRNINKICDRLENEEYDDSIKEMLERNSRQFNAVYRSKDEVVTAVKKFRECLKEREQSIENIKALRDKVYAHSDPNAKKVLLEQSELEDLHELAKEMYNALYGKIFDVYFHFRSVDWDLRYIINELKTAEKVRLLRRTDGTQNNGDA